jgi:hypothetical protein
MNIDTFFSQPLSDSVYSPPHVTEWLDIGKIIVYSKHISMGDTTFFPGDQAKLEVDDGEYRVQAKAIHYGNDRRISRLRAIRTVDSFQTVYLASISVDFARVGVCDPIVFLRALENNTNGGKDLDLYNALYSRPLDANYGIITLDTHNMVFVQSGWGDGHYHVYQLQSPDHLMGLEVVFIDEEVQVSGG